MEDFDIAVKVVVVGNGGVGKSSLIRRYCKGTFTDTYKKTIGVDFLEKQTTVKSVGETVTMMVWDTAGQEEFDAVTRGYYRGAGAAILAFSTTDRASFEAVENWKKKIEDECGKIPLAIMQNKMDLVNESVVSKDEPESLARKMEIPLFRTSVKEGMNVNEIFEFLAEQYIKTRKAENNNNKTEQIGSIKMESTAKPAESEKDKQSKSFQIQTPEKRRTGGKKSILSGC